MSYIYYQTESDLDEFAMQTMELLVANIPTRKINVDRMSESDTDYTEPPDALAFFRFSSRESRGDTALEKAANCFRAPCILAFVAHILDDPNSHTVAPVAYRRNTRDMFILLHIRSDESHCLHACNCNKKSLIEGNEFLKENKVINDEQCKINNTHITWLCTFLRYLRVKTLAGKYFASLKFMTGKAFASLKKFLRKQLRSDAVVVILLLRLTGLLPSYP